MEIVVLPTATEVATLVADVLQGYAEHGATLGLATGSTPLATYTELVRRHREDGLSFARTTAFTLDEYVGIGPDHPQSYHAVIRSELCDHVDLAAVHGPDGTADDLVAEAQRYERAITAAGGIDVQLLGIGTDGHIGFNEPMSSLASRTRVKTLTERTRADNARFFGHPDDVPFHVLTQGLGTIREAGHLLLVATGAGKAAAVAAAVEGPVGARCPASVLQLHPHATVVVDEAAAVSLEWGDYYRFAWAHKPAWQGL